jgi:sugar phosphate isomerase/epimerase
MKFAICNEIFYNEDPARWSISSQFAAAAELGFEALEIAPFTLAPHVAEISEAQKKEIVSCSEETGVAVAGLHWLLVGPQDMHLTSPDASVRESTVRYLEELARFGTDIGGSVMVVGSPQQRDIREGVKYEDAWVWFREAMARCGQVGLEADFKVCIEPLAGATKNNFLFRGHEVLRMVEEIDMPNVGIILDTYSGVKEETDLPAAIRDAGNRLFHYHCNDDSGYAPGIGDTDFVPVMEALTDIGFDRYASIEVFKSDRPAMEQAEIGLKTLKSALAQARS